MILGILHKGSIESRHLAIFLCHFPHLYFPGCALSIVIHIHLKSIIENVKSSLVLHPTLFWSNIRQNNSQISIFEYELDCWRFLVHFLYSFSEY